MHTSTQMTIPHHHILHFEQRLSSIVGSFIAATVPPSLQSAEENEESVDKSSDKKSMEIKFSIHQVCVD